MITPIGTLNINQICERKDDLLVSSDDIKRVAKNERNKALDEFAVALKKEYENAVSIPNMEKETAYFVVDRIAEQLKVGAS